MKTAKQLQKIYIRMLMNTLSEYDYKKELDRLKYVISAYPKPQRTENEQSFVDFINKNIYEKNTTFGYLKRLSKGEIKEATDNEIIKYFGSFESAQAYINKAHQETTRRIDSYFEKYRIILNDMLC